MAFSNGFSGDVVSLQYILQTLERKSYLIPGVTTNPDVSVTAAGESAYFYKRGASTVAKGKVGAKLDFTSTGVERKSIDLTDSFQIKAVLPYANFATVSADVVGDKVIQETIEVANQWNAAGLEAMIAGAKEGTATGDNIYEKILNAKAAFNTANKAKGLRPTAIIVSPAKLAELKAQNLISYKEALPGSSELVVGYFDGMAVIEGLDSTVDLVILNALAFGAPLNVNTLVVTDATAAGYPAGTLVAGEMGYGFHVCDGDLIYKYATL